ncbi:hypothetical protein MTBBW1_2280049 [Desulfamplus magnetovallimortis]|uniref:Uncharacterized protein n=1 Tax=Desulfamplus magnetovallimortis TaxID=1246637 RepID=A0A1W1HDD9_9BACT|nr:hypothetical protein MTBBW1_2280049 [Desulfamplus magnetovallimortis]
MEILTGLLEEQQWLCYYKYMEKKTQEIMLQTVNPFQTINPFGSLILINQSIKANHTGTFIPFYTGN